MGYVDNQLGLTAGCSDRYESFSNLSSAGIQAEYSTCRLGCNIKHPTSRKKRKACYQVCIGTRDGKLAKLAAETEAGIAAGMGDDVVEETTTTTTTTNQPQGRPNLETKDFGTKSAGFSAKNVIIGVAVLAALGGVVYFIKKRND